jgi:hypothetical protein
MFQEEFRHESQVRKSSTESTAHIAAIFRDT